MPFVPEEGSCCGRRLRPTFSRRTTIVLAWGFALAPSLVAQTYDVAALLRTGVGCQKQPQWRLVLWVFVWLRFPRYALQPDRAKRG